MQNVEKNVPANKVGEEVQKLIAFGAKEVTATKQRDGTYTITFVDA